MNTLKFVISEKYFTTTKDDRQTCVYSSMIPQMTACPKHLATNFTAEFKALVSHVDDRMLLK